MITELGKLLAIQERRVVKGLRDKDFGLSASVFEDPFGNRIDVGEPIS